MNDTPILLNVRQTLFLIFCWAYDPDAHDLGEWQATEKALSAAQAVFAAARKKGATELLIMRTKKAFARGKGPWGITAIDALMKVLDDRDVADALPDLFKHKEAS